MGDDKVIRISAPHFVAGVEINKIYQGIWDGPRYKYNNRRAPILKYMSRWNLFQIRDYCDKKGWHIWIR